MVKGKPAKPTGKQRGQNPEDMKPYTAHIRYGHIAQVPGDCLCTRTSHEGGSTEIKYVNRLCPAHGNS